MDYIPNSPGEREAMLRAIGKSSVEELFSSIPASIRARPPAGLRPAASELEIAREIAELGTVNTSLEESVSFLGAGCYDHYVPAVVDELFARGELWTGYTPYQAEASQGTLQLLFEYQSMICDLFAMEVTNASMYDGASALAEALLMAERIKPGGKLLLSSAIHPEYLQVARTYFARSATALEEVATQDGVTSLEDLARRIDQSTSAVAVASPNFFGSIEEMAEISRLVKRAGALLIAVVNPISLALLAPPGEYDADIAVAEGQCLGNYPSFGGGCFGILATKQAFVRQLPGRIVGETVDAEGRRTFCLTVQTREQHIRRERATSNICTNHTLHALRAGAYLAALGAGGLRKVAYASLAKAHYACDQIVKIGGFAKKFSKPFFNEFVIATPFDAAEIEAEMLDRAIFPGVNLGRFKKEWANSLLVCVTEKRTRWEIEEFVRCLKGMSLSSMS